MISFNSLSSFDSSGEAIALTGIYNKAARFETEAGTLF